MTETHIDILRIVAENKGIKRREIADMLGIDPRAHLRKMKEQKLIDSKHSTGADTYTLAPKGERLLKTLDVGMGEIAAPRTHVSKDKYTGERWNIARPNSVPEAGYRRPMLIASNVLPAKGIGA